MPTPFGSELILEERINEATLRAYCVGFDQRKFRLKELAEVIANVIPEFALGPHVSRAVNMRELVERLREAARRIYLTEKYKRRGEFGELILHLLLRDFSGSVPLLSKIYFKDAHNAAVHGFDGIHVVENGRRKELWLGESKMYASGHAGIDSLVDDLKKHLTRDYLRNEFELITSKLPANDASILFWRKELHKHRKLEDILDKVCIPMVCTFTADCYSNHSDNTAAFLKEFEQEVRALEKRFSEKRLKIATDVDIVLMLLPIKSKPDLQRELNERLASMRRI